MKKVLLIAQVNQILEFVLKKVSIENYYNDYGGPVMEKPNKDEKVAYIERKKKYQKFLTRRANSIVE